jgi:hypothetical protein
MRIWMTQTKIQDTIKDLDDKRLIAMHHEVGSLLAITAGNAREHFKNNSLRLKWENHQQYLVEAHDLLAKEMVFRGYEHHTPLDMVNYPFYVPGEPFTPTKDQIQRDRDVLKERYLKNTPKWTRRNPPEWLDYIQPYKWVHHHIAPTPEEWITLLKERKIKAPIKLYRGIKCISLEEREAVSNCHTYWSSWTDNLQIAYDFAWTDTNYSVILSRIFKPNEEVVNLKDILYNGHYGFEDEFLVPPNTFLDMEIIPIESLDLDPSEC